MRGGRGHTFIDTKPRFSLAAAMSARHMKRLAERKMMEGTSDDPEVEDEEEPEQSSSHGFAGVSLFVIHGARHPIS